MMVSDENKVQLIVVFKLGIKESKAKSILKFSRVSFNEGMDSSRGKIYFYKTGPKYILTFGTEEERRKFISENTACEEIYEMYIPDWKIQKD